MTATLLARFPGAALTLPPEVDLALAAARNRAEQVRPIVVRVLPWMVRGLVATAVVAFAFLALGPHLFGYRTMTMLSGSMAPEIETGDIAVERGLDGSVTVQTKGDANEAVDPWKATLQGDTAWQVQGVVPEVGHVIQALRTPVVSQVLRYGAVALLAGWLLLG